MVVYAPFWDTLRKNGITGYALMKHYSIGNGTLYRMRHNKSLSTNTINNLCRLLDCQVQDILLYLPDEEENEKQPASL